VPQYLHLEAPAGKSLERHAERERHDQADRDDDHVATHKEVLETSHVASPICAEQHVPGRSRRLAVAVLCPFPRGTLLAV